MKRTLSKTAATLLSAGLLTSLSGCIVYPEKVTRFNEECQIQSRHMVLTSEQMRNFGSCENAGCFGNALMAGVISAGSVVVSGTIVMAGNVVYWFEELGDCKKE